MFHDHPTFITGEQSIKYEYVMMTRKPGAGSHLILYFGFWGCVEQRCQLLLITRSHYGKLQKFSVFYGLQETFSTEIFLKK